MTMITTPVARRDPVVARPPGRTVFLVLASVVAVLTLAGTFVSLLTRVAVDHYDVTAAFSPAELAGVQQAHFANHAGHLTVTGRADRAAVLDVDVTDGLFRARRGEEIRDGTLRMQASCPWFFLTRCHVDQRAGIPAPLPLTVDARHGDVTLAGLDGQLTVDAGFGVLRLDSLGGPGVVRHGFGQLVGERLASPTLDVHHRFGDLRLSFAAAPDELRVDTQFGSAEIVLPDDGAAYDVRGATSFGHRTVDVRTDPLSDRVIQVDSSFGDLTIRYAR